MLLIFGIFIGRTTKVCQECDSIDYARLDSLEHIKDSLQSRYDVIDEQYRVLKDSIAKAFTPHPLPPKTRARHAAKSFSVAGVDSTANYLLSAPQE
jgi:hypothetical protein